MKPFGVALRAGDVVGIYSRGRSRIPEKGTVTAVNKRFLTIRYEPGHICKFGVENWEEWGSAGHIYRRYLKVWDEADYQAKVKRWAEEQRRSDVLARAGRLRFGDIVDLDALAALVQHCESVITSAQAQVPE